MAGPRRLELALPRAQRALGRPSVQAPALAEGRVELQALVLDGGRAGLRVQVVVADLGEARRLLAGVQEGPGLGVAGAEALGVAAVGGIAGKRWRTLLEGAEARTAGQR